MISKKYIIGIFIVILVVAIILISVGTNVTKKSKENQKKIFNASEEIINKYLDQDVEFCVFLNKQDDRLFCFSAYYFSEAISNKSFDCLSSRYGMSPGGTFDYPKQGTNMKIICEILMTKNISTCSNLTRKEGTVYCQNLFNPKYAGDFVNDPTYNTLLIYAILRKNSSLCENLIPQGELNVTDSKESVQRIDFYRALCRKLAI